MQNDQDGDSKISWELNKDKDKEIMHDSKGSSWRWYMQDGKKGDGSAFEVVSDDRKGCYDL